MKIAEVCKTDGHWLWDKPDRTSMSEEYYDCHRAGCEYTDRRTK